MVIFFYGEDDFRAKRKIRELREKFEREVDKSGDSFDWLDGASATLKEINQKAAPASLLARKRMIVIENIFKNRDKEILPAVAEYFQAKEKNGSENIIIFCENSIKSKRKMGGMEIVKRGGEHENPLTKKEKALFDFLSGQKFVQEFKPLSGADLAGWAKDEFAARGGRIAARAIQTLIALVGGNLWQLDKEINKLINYKEGKEPQIAPGAVKAEIGIEDVEELVKGNFDETIFNLTDAIGARDRARASRLLEEQVRLGAGEAYLLVMITRQIKIILQARAALDIGHSPRQIASDIKQHPFVAQKAADQARNFKLEDLKRILSELIEIDSEMKTGRAEPLARLDLLISRI